MRRRRGNGGRKCQGYRSNGDEENRRRGSHRKKGKDSSPRAQDLRESVKKNHPSQIFSLLGMKEEKECMGFGFDFL
jgi:hypothetical protein